MWKIFNWLGMGNNKSWTQGKFTPKHPDKCVNIKVGKKPFARSSWELKMMNWLDENKNVVKWGSEILKIPYVYDIDKVKGVQKLRHYYPDFYIELINKNSQLKKYVVEIKPGKQMVKPPMPKNKTRKAMKNYGYALYEYIKNKNKKKYAELFCEGKNWEYKVITEQDIFKEDL